MAAGNTEPVRPTSVRLPEDLYLRLDAEAKRQGITLTELHRQALELRLAVAEVHAAAAAGENIADKLGAILESLGRRP